ncbi:MAG: GDSL-type esterase/lipase family protein [Acholeplasmatales bacterium]
MEILFGVLFGIALIGGIVAAYYAYKKGKKAGKRDLFNFIRACGFDQKVRDFKILNERALPNATVFVGDSIIQDYNVHEWFFDIPTYNRGIGGDTTEGLLNRLDVSIFNLAPKNVVLLIGTNDLELTNDKEEVIYQRIKEIVEKINKTIKTNIYLLSILPTNIKMNREVVGKRSIKRITNLNNLISKIEGAEYIDLFSHLLDEKNKLNSKYSNEGLHLNQEGYKVITDILKPKVFKL